MDLDRKRHVLPPGVPLQASRRPTCSSPGEHGSNAQRQTREYSSNTDCGTAAGATAFAPDRAADSPTGLHGRGPRASHRRADLAAATGRGDNCASAPRCPRRQSRRRVRRYRRRAPIIGARHLLCRRGKQVLADAAAGRAHPAALCSARLRRADEHRHRLHRLEQDGLRHGPRCRRHSGRRRRLRREAPRVPAASHRFYRQEGGEPLAPPAHRPHPLWSPEAPPDFCDVFVLPSPSAAARRYWKVEPWQELADWLRATAPWRF